MSGRLSALQVRILRTLAGALTGRWVLTDGAALGDEDPPPQTIAGIGGF